MGNDQVSTEEWNERIAFQIYLRTGKMLPAVSQGELQVKFNPWHDPEDGRFTFAGQGTYFGGKRQDVRRGPSPQKQRANTSPNLGKKPPHTFKPSGGTGGGAGVRGKWSQPSQNSKPRGGDFSGGGSFGGGGAGGGWSEVPVPPKPKKADTSRPTIPAGQSAPPRKRMGVSVRKPTTTIAQPSKPVIHKNGYNFEVNAETGAHRRTEHVFGELQSEPKEKRSKREQLQAGGAHRGKTDDGGHFIAPRFNGPRDWFNHFAQNSNINRGAYRVIEDGWAKERTLESACSWISLRAILKIRRERKV